MIPQIEIVLFLTRRSYAYYVVVFVVSYPVHRLNIEPLDDITRGFRNFEKRISESNFFILLDFWLFALFCGKCSMIKLLLFSGVGFNPVDRASGHLLTY